MSRHFKNAARGTCCGFLATAILAYASAHAAVTISTDPTQNMSCSASQCAPTATDAVLNVGDLETLLAGGSLTVTTQGSGVDAGNMVVAAPLSWSNQSLLTLTASTSLLIAQPISVAGSGSGLALNYQTKKEFPAGGMLITAGANVTFADTGSTLKVNRKSYVLAADLPSLAGAIAAKPSGNFALAQSYDASVNGVYAQAPIPTLDGAFEGLGNTISNLSINDASNNDVGLFGNANVVRDIALSNANVVSTLPGFANVGALVGTSNGHIINGHSSGAVTAQGESNVGGIVGTGSAVAFSSSTASVSAPSGSDLFAGGLAGEAEHVSSSFAAGNVSLAATASIVGGLVGYAPGGNVASSYARGSAQARDGSSAGGLAGYCCRTAKQSYSTGATHAHNGDAGGFLGTENGGHYKADYWDTETSGRTHAAGNLRKVHGVKGVPTAQLTSGLPLGFDPTVWASDPAINNGYPYLIYNPPSN